MSIYGKDRDGKIETWKDAWIATCGRCGEQKVAFTYQEASIWLTRHAEIDCQANEDTRTAGDLV